MPLSISNFEIRVPKQQSFRFSIFAGCLIAITVGCIFEFGLRYHGMKPQNRDTKELWAAQRARASVLGQRAIILVGASRIQLDIDLEILESTTHLTPIQLAIDGTSFLPVLEDLVSDPKITGTVLVDLTSGILQKTQTRYKSTEWVEFYNQEYKGLFSPTVEMLIKAKVKSLSNIYSSGIPLPILFKLALGLMPVTENYLVTDEKRERDADYTMVKQPNFYLGRAIRHLGQNVDFKGVITFEQAKQKIRDLIPSKTHKKTELSSYSYINKLTTQLQEKGARVIYIRFPTSGLCWEIDQARTPKEYYWNQFAKYSIAPTIHFNDYPELQYELADGSHLDQSQKKEFTRSLAQAIQQKL